MGLLINGKWTQDEAGGTDGTGRFQRPGLLADRREVVLGHLDARKPVLGQRLAQGRVQGRNVALPAHFGHEPATLDKDCSHVAQHRALRVDQPGLRTPKHQMSGGVGPARAGHAQAQDDQAEVGHDGHPRRE